MRLGDCYWHTAASGSNPCAKIRSSLHAENSDVLPDASVAVAVTAVCPGGVANSCDANVVMPLLSLATSAEPMNVLPSP